MGEMTSPGRDRAWEMFAAHFVATSPDTMKIARMGFDAGWEAYRAALAAVAEWDRRRAISLSADEMMLHIDRACVCSRKRPANA